jgi:hypothetical protein
VRTHTEHDINSGLFGGGTTRAGLFFTEMVDRHDQASCNTSNLGHGVDRPLSLSVRIFVAEPCCCRHRVDEYEADLDPKPLAHDRVDVADYPANDFSGVGIE